MDDAKRGLSYERRMYILIETRKSTYGKLDVEKILLSPFQERVWEKLFAPMMDENCGLLMFEAASRAEIEYLCEKLKGRKGINVTEVRKALFETADIETADIKKGDQVKK